MLPDEVDILQDISEMGLEDVLFVKFSLPALTDEKNLKSSAVHMHNAVTRIVDGWLPTSVNGSTYYLFHFVDSVIAVLVGDPRRSIARMAKHFSAAGFTLPQMEPQDHVRFCGAFVEPEFCQFHLCVGDDSNQDLKRFAARKSRSPSDLRLLTFVLSAIASPDDVQLIRASVDFVAMASDSSAPAACFRSASDRSFFESKVKQYITDKAEPLDYDYSDDSSSPIFCLTSGSSGLTVLAQVTAEMRFEIMAVSLTNFTNKTRAIGALSCELMTMRCAFLDFRNLMVKTVTIWVSDNAEVGKLLLSPELSTHNTELMTLAEEMAPVALFAAFVGGAGDFSRIAAMKDYDFDAAVISDQTASEAWTNAMTKALSAPDPLAAISLQAVPLAALRVVKEAPKVKSPLLMACHKEVGAFLPSWASECARAIQADSGASIRSFMQAAKSGGAVDGLTFVLDDMVVWATADSKALKLVVPAAMRARIVAVAHERFRCCSSATKQRLMSKLFWWPRMLGDIERHTICAECARCSNEQC